jgi:hypothetical protein
MADDLRHFKPGERWHELDMLREEYKEFGPFLYDVITGLLGFNCTPLQLDIARYLERGPKYRMIQAQRGQAKTTITAAYAVWRIIHDPTTRILIVSSGSDMATEIANWVIQIIMGMEELECLRPDRGAGDRVSVKAFDVHYELKGPEKSPSIACIGITSNMQGKRADVLIADDVESAKNSATEVQRERLRHLTRDFTSICSTGDIIYLGTPQSVDSIYNGLVSRGFDIRIWPGRYPTGDEINNYGKHLAPAIRTALDDAPDLQFGGGPMGDRGKPTDPVLLDEGTLTAKEIDQGAAYFQLQHMLDTRLMDAHRFPLKSDKLVFMHVADKSAPLDINFQPGNETHVTLPMDWPIADSYYRASSFGTEFGPFQGTHMYVDPAGGGQNGDETAYAVTKFLAGRVFLVDVGGVPGGLDEEPLRQLTEVAVKWQPSQIDIEKNYGNGALASVWRPMLFRQHSCGVEDVWESGQKELRIIDVLEPVIGSNRLVVDEGLLELDWDRCKQYPVEQRPSYSFFYQLSRITREKGALIHDDRLDAVAGSVRHWADHLSQDEFKARARAAQSRYKDMMKNPLGNGRAVPGWQSFIKGNKTTTGALSRMRRRY